MTNKSYLIASLAALLTVPASSAQAAPPPPASLPNCNAAATFASKPMTFVSCFGALAGNDDMPGIAAQVSTSFAAFIGGATVTNLGKSDAAGAGPFTANVTSAFGTLNFDSPQFGYFALILKGSTAYSGYLFNAGAAGMSSVDFNMAGTAVNANNVVQGLSHARLLSIQSPAGGCVGCEPNIVPEPSSFALMFGGLLGMGVAARRRRNS